MKDARGNTVYGTPEDQRGALIDTTSPECGNGILIRLKRTMVIWDINIIGRMKTNRISALMNPSACRNRSAHS